MLPFSRDAFFALFEQYNAAVWPAQLIAYGLGLVALALLLRPFPGSGRAIAGLLALAWLWNGIVYHGLHFAQINFWAYGFAALFAVQSVLFAVAALRDRPDWRFRRDAAGWAGLALAGFAMVINPLIGMAFGHTWPRVEIFGVAPTPTVVFTWGVLLLARPRPVVHLTVIPLLWSLISAATAFGLGVTEDLTLLLAAAVALAMMLR